MISVPLGGMRMPKVPDACYDAGRQFPAITAFVHLRNGDAGKSGSRCQAGSGNCLEYGRSDDRCQRQASRHMADKFPGCPIHLFRDARIERNLTHEDKERNNHKCIGCKGIKKVLCQKVNGRRQGSEDGKSDKPDKCHGKRELDSRQEKSQQKTQANTADQHLVHIRIHRSGFGCKASMISESKTRVCMKNAPPIA